MITNPVPFIAGIIWLFASILYFRRSFKQRGKIALAFIYLLLAAWMLMRGVT